MPHIHLFTDIEADGPVPGIYSMLSFASVAFTYEGEPLGEFERNLTPLPGASQSPATMAWWKTEPEAWNYCQQNQSTPDSAFKAYAEWTSTLPGTPILVAQPASFDSMWIEYYSQRFLGHSLFNGPAFDLRSFAAPLLGRPFSECGRSKWPKEWLGEFDHNHKAIDDARGYAHAFQCMRKINEEMQSQRPGRTPTR